MVSHRHEGRAARGRAHGRCRPESFRGAVELLASTPGWTGDRRVGGRAVVVTGTAAINKERGTLALGALVEVHGPSRPDGSLLGDRVEVEWHPSSSGSSLTNAWLLPSGARENGRDDASYTTNVTMSNTGSSSAQPTLRFLGHERDGRTGPDRSFALAAGATITFADVPSSAFAISDDYGAIVASSSVATLVVESTTSTPGGAFAAYPSVINNGTDVPRILLPRWKPLPLSPSAPQPLGERCR